jgi:ParB/RepB/Spo0J family partition protein
VDKLNLEDESFQVRLSSRPDHSLVDSVRNLGIQIPLIVRPHPKKKGTYQLICGFRRATVATQIGLETVPALVRPLADEQAQAVAYIENEHRKTLGELDRARAMARMRSKGKTTAQIASLFRLSDRQVQRIEGLLDYPEELRAAMEGEGAISPTLALVLWQAKKRHQESLDLSSWIAIAAAVGSVERLRRRIEASYGGGCREAVRRSDRQVTIYLDAVRSATPADKSDVVRQLRALIEEFEAPWQ